MVAAKLIKKRRTMLYLMEGPRVILIRLPVNPFGRFWGFRGSASEPSRGDFFRFQIVHIHILFESVLPSLHVVEIQSDGYSDVTDHDITHGNVTHCVWITIIGSEVDSVVAFP